VQHVPDQVRIAQGTTQFDFSTSVRFPHTDLPLVLKHLSTAVHDPQKMEHFWVACRDWRIMTAEHDLFHPLLFALWNATIEDACTVDLAGQAGVQLRVSDLEDLQILLDLTVGYAIERDLPARRARVDVGSDPHRGEVLDEHILGFGRAEDWQYEVHPVDHAVKEAVVSGEVQRRHTGPADFRFSASVRFPRSDLPAIVERLSRAARDQRR
jgi:hypothetical protein